MGKIKFNRIKREDIPTLAMAAGGAWLLATAYTRHGMRSVINQLGKEGLKVVNSEGQEINLGLKPLIHID